MQHDARGAQVVGQARLVHSGQLWTLNSPSHLRETPLSYLGRDCGSPVAWYCGAGQFSSLEKAPKGSILHPSRRHSSPVVYRPRLHPSNHPACTIQPPSIPFLCLWLRFARSTQLNPSRAHSSNSWQPAPALAPCTLWFVSLWIPILSPFPSPLSSSRPSQSGGIDAPGDPLQHLTRTAN